MNLSQLLKEMALDPKHAERFKKIRPEIVTDTMFNTTERHTLANSLYGKYKNRGSARSVFETKVLDPKALKRAKEVYGSITNIPTAFKLARTEQGRGQNKAEYDTWIKIKQHPKIAKLFAELLNADTDNWWWIEMELCTPMDEIPEAEVYNYFGFQQGTRAEWDTPFDVILPDIGVISAKSIIKEGQRRNILIKTKNEKRFWWIFEFEKLLKLFPLATLGDLPRYENWGKTKDGRMVIIDYGLTKSTYNKYYAPSKIPRFNKKEKTI